MLYYQTLDKSTLELLKKLQQREMFSNLRLVGGTALALQIGHRTSIDIDLFGSIETDELDINRELSEIGDLIQIKRSKNIHIYLLNNIKLDIVNYPYPWLREPIKEDKILMASIEDIAAMKIAAISGRGSKKDFVDLFFLLQKMDLLQILELYQKKYNDGSLFMAIKSIIYFEDAEGDEMPHMFSPISWEYIKQAIMKAYHDYIHKTE